MNDLCLHLHYELDGEPTVEEFSVPTLPLPGAAVVLLHPDPRRGGEGEVIEWVVLPTPYRWEFCRVFDEQLATHVHLELGLATGQ